MRPPWWRCGGASRRHFNIVAEGWKAGIICSSLLQHWLRPWHCFLPTHADAVVYSASPPAPQVCSRATMDLLTRERLPELTTETR